MAHGKQEISVWFFIGVLLLIYGVLIEGAALTGGDSGVTLAEYHIGRWWGMLLIVLGVLYSVVFRPKKA